MLRRFPKSPVWRPLPHPVRQPTPRRRDGELRNRESRSRYLTRPQTARVVGRRTDAAAPHPARCVPLPLWTHASKRGGVGCSAVTDMLDGTGLVVWSSRGARRRRLHRIMGDRRRRGSASWILSPCLPPPCFSSRTISTSSAWSGSCSSARATRCAARPTATRRCASSSTCGPTSILLDIGLPGMDGWQVLERVRDLSDVPVVMLTAQGDELDKVRGLRAGADDFVTKPFGAPGARRARRARCCAAGPAPPPAPPRPTCTSTPGCASTTCSASLRVGGAELRLTPLEFRLLSTLVRNAGQLLSGQQLVELVLGRPTSPPLTRSSSRSAGCAASSAATSGRPDRDGPRLRLPLPAAGVASAPRCAEPGGFPSRRRRRGDGGGDCGEGRQRDLEPRSAPRAGAAGDPAAVQFGDGARDREPETGALARIGAAQAPEAPAERAVLAGGQAGTLVGRPRCAPQRPRRSPPRAPCPRAGSSRSRCAGQRRAAWCTRAGSAVDRRAGRDLRHQRDAGLRPPARQRPRRAARRALRRRPRRA